MNNVDTIHLLDDEVTLDLRGGALAPGIADEGDGSSEIELLVEHGIGGALELRLGGRSDHLTAGNLGRERDGFNLNADEVVPDVDLTLVPQESGFGRAQVAFNLGKGSDTFSASGGPGFVGRARDQLDLSGGQGTDEIAGGSRTDFILGGPGPDLLRGEVGMDIVDARGDGRDRVDCGPGLDVVDASRDDRTRSCKSLDELTDEELAQLLGH